MKRYKDMAREVDELKDSGREFEGLVPVKAKVAKRPKAVVSFRIDPSELEVVTKAAESKSLPLADFLRLAALAAADSGSDAIEEGRRVQAVRELREKARDLAEAAERL